MSKEHSFSYMVDNLMGKPSIVLQKIVIPRSTSTSQLFDHWQNLAQLVVRDVGQFCSMMLWYHKLKGVSLVEARTKAVETGLFCLKYGSVVGYHWEVILTACPLLRGSMSRKARILSDSKSLRAGISPVGRVN